MIKCPKTHTNEFDDQMVIFAFDQDAMNKTKKKKNIW